MLCTSPPPLLLSLSLSPLFLYWEGEFSFSVVIVIVLSLKDTILDFFFFLEYTQCVMNNSNLCDSTVMKNDTELQLTTLCKHLNQQVLLSS